ncbi:MAG: DUF58 domain-containing protein [Bdellovibrionales bacterium]|nr:DUF58 domain-containing protein [Bdellovibrionales bacterium]
MDRYRDTKLSPEVLAEIRKLHFHTRQLASEGIAGQYRSAFRGRGMEFEEVREYTPGDDVRSIDWKVSARMNQPYIKMFREERELTVMIAVDVSGSTLTGTRNFLRDELIARVGAVLTLIALMNNDKVGLVTFDSKLRTYHPPRKARGAVWRILHEVMGSLEAQRVKSSSAGTNLADMCDFLSKVLKRRSIVFILSDFMDSSIKRTLGTLSKRHDVTAIIAGDPADLELPDAGLIKITDPETDVTSILDTSDPFIRRKYNEKAMQAKSELRTLLARHRVGRIELQTNQPFMPMLARYFGQRSSRRTTPGGK